MAFGIEQCGMALLKLGKLNTSTRIDVVNSEEYKIDNSQTNLYMSGKRENRTTDKKEVISYTLNNWKKGALLISLYQKEKR